MSHRYPLSLLLIASGLLLLLACLGSLLFGAGHVTAKMALDALLGRGSDETLFVLVELRGPRTLIALVAGLSLGCAGALMQTLARNPLAEPGLLGVSAGSVFAVTIAFLLGSSSASLSVYIAQAGALVGCLVVLSIARLNSLNTNPIRLVLAGATLSSLLLAMTSLLLMLDQRAADEIRFWITGSVAGRELSLLWQLAPSLLIALVLTLVIVRPLATLSLGENIATNLGHKPARIRFITVIIVALLVGAATSLAGPILFVGLVVPFVARAFAGSDIRQYLLLCVFIGPIMLITADTLSRLLVAPSELPLGVLTALIGAPVLLAIVRTNRLPKL